MSFKGFTAGLITGAVAGTMMGMLIDPMDDKSHRQMRRTRENIFRTLGGMLEDLTER